MTNRTPALPPLYFSPPNDGEATAATTAVAVAEGEERAAAAPPPSSSPLLSTLPPELLHSCLARYADWGDLARLACVRSEWRDAMCDAATYGGRDAAWELSMCMLHGDDRGGRAASGRRTTTTPQGEEEEEGKQQCRVILANGEEEGGEDARNNDDDDDDDDARTGNNRGLEKNEALAVKYLARLCGVAVEVGSGTAAVTSSVLPGDGESSSAVNDPVAAAAADEAALLELASCCLSGTGLPRGPDPAAAVRCLTSAYHIAGSVESAHRLALLYEYPDMSGGLVPVDVVAAFEWFRAAAAGGHVESMAELALCYELGCGVDRSDEEALDWYTKAANAGHSASHYSVGEHFEEARGVNMDHEEACLWYYRAAVLGEEDGVGGLRRLADVARRVVPQAEEGLYNHARGAGRAR